MSRYLVTGGAGFIGSNIVEELVLRGESVRVFDSLVTGFMEHIEPFIDKIEFIKGDVRNMDEVEKAVSGMDYVIHQAALRSVAKSVEDPFITDEVNTRGSLNVIMASKEAGVKRLVYASTSAAYGDTKINPQHEDLAPRPISPYGVSKLAAEYYCYMAASTMGLETVALRYFNVFGPRQNPESMYSAVIPAFIDKLMKGEPCTIDGDGRQERDFVYVKNVVDANLTAAVKEGVSGNMFNVGSGEVYSVIDLAEELKEIMGKKDLENLYGPRRQGDADKTSADITKLKEVLGVTPKIGFKEGLEKTIEWFKCKG